MNPFFGGSNQNGGFSIFQMANLIGLIMNNGNPMQQLQQMYNNGSINEMQFKLMTSAFQGNPEEVAQNLMNSGQMSQNQFNSFSAMIPQIMQFIKR